MRIEGAPYVVDLSRPEAVPKGGGEAGGVRGAAAASRVPSFDRVEISSRARELEGFKRDLAALPEVRLDRVALARQQLQYGSYRVDPLIIAQKMVQSPGSSQGEVT